MFVTLFLTQKWKETPTTSELHQHTAAQPGMGGQQHPTLGHHFPGGLSIHLNKPLSLT